MTRTTFRHIFAGEVVESDLILATTPEWRRAPESRDPAWVVSKDGRRIKALRLSLPGDPYFVERLFSQFDAYCRAKALTPGDENETPKSRDCEDWKCL
jgi:hypothetical protein